MSDLSETLRLALRTGDRDAWNEVVQSEAGRLHAIAWAITRDSGLTEDAVQDTFLRLVEGRVRAVRRGAARALLASITARIAIDALRRREARRRREEAHGMARPERGDDHPAERTVLAGEAARNVDEALALLDPLTRAAVWLHVVEGQGVREVARAIGAPRSTTADRIRTGISRLEVELRRRGLASVLTLGWVALLLESARGTPSRELVDRLLGLGARLQPGVPVVRGGWTGRSTLARAASLAGVILAAGGMALLVLQPPEKAPGGVATSPVPTVRWVTVEDARRKPSPAGDSPAPSREQGPAESVETFRIGGTVYDAETRVPVPRARVRPEKPAPALAGVRREATSGPDGELELVLPVDADEAFVAEADGYLPTGSIWVSRDRGLEHVYFALRPLLEVSGQVVGEDGEPLAGARVEIHGVSQGKRTSFPSGGGGGTATGPDGRFTVRLPEIGQPRLSVLAPGYGGVVHMGAIPGARDLLVTVPRGARVAGIILDAARRPAAAARVRWSTDLPENTGWNGEATADAEGRFELILPAKAAHIVHAHEGERDHAALEEALRAGARFVERIEVAHGRDPREIVLDLGSLRDWREAKARERAVATQGGARTIRRREPEVKVRGITIGPGGKPVSNALTRVLFTRPYYGSRAQAVTGSDGRFEASGSEPPGTCRVQLLVTHRAWAEKRVDLGEVTIDEAEAGVAFPDLEVQLSAGYTLTGRLVDGSRAAVEGALVLATDPEQPETLRLLARTGEDGRFRLEHRLMDEEVVLTFSKPGFAMRRLERGPGLAADGGATDVGDIVLSRGGAVEGFALREDGSPASWSAVALEGPWLIGAVRTDGSGRFRFENVQAGTARIAVLRTDSLHGGYLPMEPPLEVEVVEGATTRRDIRLAE